MSNSIESKKQLPIEEKIKIIFKLRRIIPPIAQFSLVDRVAGYIQVREKELNIYEAKSILSASTEEIKSFVEEVIAEGNFEELLKAKKIVLKSFGKFEEINEQGRLLLLNIARKLQQIASAENYQPLIEAGEIYKKFHEKELLKSVVEQLEQIGRETGNLDLLYLGGKFLIESYVDLEHGLQLFIEAGRYKDVSSAIHKNYLRAEEYKELELEAKNKLEEEEKNRISNSCTDAELRSGSGDGLEQAEAWLKVDDSLKALRILLLSNWSNLMRQVNSEYPEKTKEIITQHGLQAKAEDILKQLEPSIAVYKAKLLDMPSNLIVDLVEKALKCSNRVIEHLEEEINLLELKNKHSLDGKELEKILDKKYKALIKICLERKDYDNAIKLAENNGRLELANKLIRKELSLAIQDGNLRKAAELAKKLNDPELEYAIRIQNKDYDEALNLAVGGKWTDKLVYIISSHCSEIKSYYGCLNNAVLHLQQVLQEENNLSEENKKSIATTIKIAACHSKKHYEEEGRFGVAAEYCQMLGENELANTYLEIDFILPERQHEGCYITTACCEVMGLKDNCSILQNLRKLRDYFMAGESGLIELYYETAPKILTKIDKKELEKIFFSAIKPASDLVELGKYQEAFEIYKTKVVELIKKYL